MGVDHVDARIAEIAGRQDGAISRRQLRQAGLGRGAIEHRLATGSLHPRHRGVYLVGHWAPAPRTEQFAAVLACGPQAAVSHHAAGADWRIRPAAPPPIDVTVPGGDPRRHPGIRVHRVAAAFDPIDVRIRAGLRVTAPARTLLDLAAVLPERELRWAVEEARVLRLVSTDDLRSVINRHHRRHGVGRLRAVLRAAGSAPALTRSEAERRLADLIAEALLPAPVLNARVAGHEVDALWLEQRLVVEVDGFAYHSGREAFERDRRRDATLQAAGFTVTCLTWRRITEERLAVAALLAQLLARDRGRAQAGGVVPEQRPIESSR